MNNRRDSEIVKKLNGLRHILFVSACPAAAVSAKNVALNQTIECLYTRITASACCRRAPARRRRRNTPVTSSRPISDNPCITMHLIFSTSFLILHCFAHGMSIPPEHGPATPDVAMALSVTNVPYSCPRNSHPTLAQPASNTRNYRQDCEILLNELVAYGRRAGVQTFSRRPQRVGVTQLPFKMAYGECKLSIDALYDHKSEEDTFSLGSLRFLFQYIMSSCKFSAAPSQAGAVPIPPRDIMSLYIYPRNGFSFDAAPGLAEVNDTLALSNEHTE